MKLYDFYPVVSKKTVRTHEKFYRNFKKRDSTTLGSLVKTNRGYFIDGKEVDNTSAAFWLMKNNYVKEFEDLLIAPIN